MKLNKFIFFFLFFILAFKNTPALSIGAGTSLWQQSHKLYQGLDFFIMDNLHYKEHQFSFELHAPIIFGSEPKNYIIPGHYTNFENRFDFLSDKKYLPLHLPLLTYKKNNTEAGIKRVFISKEGKKLIIYGGPLFNSQSPYIGSQLFFENPVTAVYTSALTKPSFIMNLTEMNFFKDVNQSVLKNMNFVFLGWMDFLSEKEPQNYGTGIEIKTGAPRFLFIKPGLLFSTEVIRVKKISTSSEYNNSYRLTSGFFLDNDDYDIDFAVTYNEKSHPLGPYISYLYPMRKKNDLFEYENNFSGFLFQISEPKAKTNGFHLAVEYFFLLKPIFSLRTDYFLRHETTEFVIAFIRENIENIEDLNNLYSKNSFFCIELNSYLIKNFVRIKWATYLNWHQGSSLRSYISTVLIF
ncbi:MAG: hypothetical protein OEZ22_09365 [Spirochaetia bacterium]|nr:hypothetical protein [Spirochaetia bacterium]